MTRYITLTDGSGMGNSVYVFETNAPVEELKELERISNEVYINGGDEEDVPIWGRELTIKGYVFDYKGEHQHVTAYGTSDEWLEKNYSFVTEHYVIENQVQPNPHLMERGVTMDKDKILKMKEWMFELTGEWNVFLFKDDETIEAYKATVDAYKETNALVPSPPFVL